MALIRDAKEEDLEQINAILKTNGQLSDVGEDDIKNFVVAEVDGKVVGCGTIKEYTDSVEITRVSVLPENQGIGVGMEITMTLMGRIKGRKCWLLSVDSHDFWQNFGFYIVPDKEAPSEAQESCVNCGRRNECHRVVMVKEAL
jgi:amino-acid N-acetyltransferase